MVWLFIYKDLFTIKEYKYGPHILKVTAKAEKEVVSLARIMRNIKWPSRNTRALLSEAIHNIVLYGAPI